ncbi:MAG: hypothetical protein ACK5TN_06145 [Acidobacteriota bacterium]
MGVTPAGVNRAILSLFFLLSLASSALAQPRLRLTETALGPISVAVGANGAAQTVEASNIGSGSLALSFSSNATWLAASAGAQRPCQVAVQQGACIPVTISLSTAALARGSYTGAITVRDPNAIDAPQTITVTVQVGGGVPDNIFLYTQPNGGSDSVRFSTNSVLTTNVTTATGGSWLTVAYEGQGSFRFVQPYRISGTHQPGMPEGTYNGTLQVGGSAFAGDNKSVPVRLVVTSQPIAFLGPEQVRVKYRQGGEPQVVNIGVGNRGRGTLTVGAVTPTLANGSGWMTAAPASGFTGLSITLTPGSLAPGTYRGSVAVAVNAINGPTLTVPVEMEIVANPVPTISTGGVLNNANFAANDPLGVGTIAAVFGEFLADQLAAAPGAPLPTTLSGVRVLVNGRAAPLYFVSPGQINFQVPFETLGGDAIVQVERGGAVGNRVAVNIVSQAGRILVWPGLRHGIIVNADGSLPLPPGVQLGAFPTKAARPGDVLVIYAIGFGQTAPAVASGAASPSGPLAQLSNVIVRFGATTLFDTTIPVAAQFAGLSPGFVGLYQINVQVPRGVPASSEYDLSIQYNNQLSNQVKIAVQP